MGLRAQILPAPPKYSLIKPLCSIVVGIWGIIGGSEGAAGSDSPGSYYIGALSMSGGFNIP